MAQSTTDGQIWGESVGDGVSDADLVARSLQGRQDAFEALFDRYARQVYSIAYRISGSPTDAEDLTQDIFLRAFRTLGTLRQPQAVAAWLYQMATNVCLDALRRRKVPQAELSESVVALHPDDSRWRSPEAMALAGDDQRAVWEALGRLAPSQRAALSLRELYGLNYGEIATTLGTSVGAVEVLIFRARRRFREQYEKVAAGATAKTGEKALRCVEARSSLAAVLDDERAAGKERAAALAHVRTCPTCQAEIAAQRRDNRARILLPLLPLPITVKGHVFAHLASAIGTAAAGTGAAATGTTITASSGSGMAATAATSSATVGTAGAGSTAATTATVAAAAAGAKIGLLTGSKALLVAAAIMTATAAVAAPLLRPHHPQRIAAPRTTGSQHAQTTAGGGSRSGTSSLGPSAIGTRLRLLVHALKHGFTAAPAPRMSHPRVRHYVTRTTAIPLHRPITPTRQPQPHTPTRRTRSHTARAVTVTHVSTTQGARPARQVHTAPRSRPTHHAPSSHVKKLSDRSYTTVRRPAPRRPVIHKATHHSPIRRYKVTRPRPVMRHRATPVKKVLRRVHKPPRRAPPRGLLSVAWPGGLLRFDRRQALRVHTLPGAYVDVALHIERIAAPHSLGSRGPRVVYISMHARADRHGDASVPLRYAYVPTRPTPVTVIVTVHDGSHLQQRSATMTLVRR